MHRNPPHRARALRHEETLVGREAATAATDGAFRTVCEEKRRAHIICTKKQWMQESRMMRINCATTEGRGEGRGVKCVFSRSELFV